MQLAWRSSFYQKSLVLWSPVGDRALWKYYKYQNGIFWWHDSAFLGHRTVKVSDGFVDSSWSTGTTAALAYCKSMMCDRKSTSPGRYLWISQDFEDKSRKGHIILPGLCHLCPSRYHLEWSFPQLLQSVDASLHVSSMFRNNMWLFETYFKIRCGCEIAVFVKDKWEVCCPYATQKLLMEACWVASVLVSFKHASLRRNCTSCTHSCMSCRQVAHSRTSSERQVNLVWTTVPQILP